jgi:hypothetical protein
MTSLLLLNNLKRIGQELLADSVDKGSLEITEKRPNLRSG